MAWRGGISWGGLAVAVAGAVAMVHVGCNDDNNQPSGTASTGGTTGTSSLDDAAVATGDDAGVVDTGADAVTRLSDGAVAAVMAEANGGEVLAGQLVSTQSQSDEVRAFAQRMVTDHSMANERLMTLLQRTAISPEDSEPQRMLAAATLSTLARLSAMSDSAFDLAYVNSQVDMHQRVLQLLDDVLIPSAENADLSAELRSARQTAAMHLDAAQALWASLRQQPDPGVIP
jgi:putative membrane protein